MQTLRAAPCDVFLQGERARRQEGVHGTSSRLYLVYGMHRRRRRAYLSAS